MESHSATNIDVNYIANQLAMGKIMIYPTDTILGIGCIGNIEKVVNKLYSIKKRSINQPVSYLFPSISLIKEYVQIPDIAEKLLQFLPGPITLILPLKDSLQKLQKLYGLTDGFIGVRLIDKPWLNEIIDQLGKPIITTSVNTSGRPSATQYDDIEEDILQHVDLIINEKLANHESGSTIVKIYSDNQWEIIREGKFIDLIKEELLRY